MGHLGDEVVDAYVDGGLTPGERAAVEAHLAGCAGCRAALAGARELFAAFGAVPNEPLMVDLAPRVLRRIAPVAGARRRWLVAGVLAAQGAVALALALWLVPAIVAEYWPGAAWPGIEWSAVRGWLPAGGGALGVLGPLQWALAVVGMAVVWLIGNWLIVAGSGRRAAGEAG
jgi:anti-sigma factor RsiW